MNYSRDEITSPKKILDEQRMVSDIMTQYDASRRLCRVSCLSDEKIWICGQNSILRLYNLHGELLNSIQTKSNNMPYEIEVPKSGNWIYTVIYKTLYMVKNAKQIQEYFRLQRWKPSNLCSASTNDLLVILNSNDYNNTNAVRYAGSTEKTNHTV